MDLGVVVVWLFLLIYVIIILKTKIIEKKERKWAFLLILIAFACSMLVLFNISLNGAVTFLNNTIGKLSRMVVKI